ncbi:MAG: exodeoxyribonuclease VII large subunit [Phycisphaerae bacterium]|nr:exodeoxyribonuclease VII large subunit [Phycisphaerae bacterium]
MSRLPFDPAKMAAAKPSGPTAGAVPAPLRVGQLAAMVEGALRALPTPVRLIGEVSNFTHRGHWYFAVKDSDAVISCVMFANRAKAAGFVPADGREVIVTGRVEFYKPQGRVSFYVEGIEPVGLGALQLAFQKLVAEVRGLGWMDPGRKRPLPSFPRRIAVITSRTGAALQDVLATMRARCPAVDVAFIDVLVQGPDAAPSVARALRWVGSRHRALGIDAVIVTRGGGSIEDLWAFNERTVAEAIVQCPVPVAAAIGHETDTTIAELVADERCATPTQAAMRLTPDRAALREQLELLVARMRQSLNRSARAAGESLRSNTRHLTSAVHARSQAAARRLEQAVARLERSRPSAVYAQRSAGLRALADRLREAAARRIEAADPRPIALALRDAWQAQAARHLDVLDGLQRQLSLVGPQAVLARGYSVTFDERGRVVRRPSDAPPGQPITTRLADGTLESVVRRVSSDPLAPATALPAPPTRPRAARRRHRPSDDGPGLFA